MATVMRGPLVVELAGVWPETPVLLEQAARNTQPVSAIAVQGAASHRGFMTFFSFPG
jgi:hypothetical protein